MKYASFAIAAALTALCVWAQQRYATTSLFVRVDPEQHLMPGGVGLNFRVSADGSADLLSQTQPVAAWVRALPGRNIRITAAASGLPPQAELRWVSSVDRATGGAQGAQCTSGTFHGPSNDLVANWSRSGILTCGVTFQLSNPREIPAGSYPVAVTFSLHVE